MTFYFILYIITILYYQKGWKMSKVLKKKKIKKIVADSSLKKKAAKKVVKKMLKKKADSKKVVKKAIKKAS